MDKSTIPSKFLPDINNQSTFDLNKQSVQFLGKYYSLHEKMQKEKQSSNKNAQSNLKHQRTSSLTRNSLNLKLIEFKQG